MRTLLNRHQWVRLGWWLGLSLLATASNAAEIYKWTDRSGHVHFGDKPGGAATQTVPLRPLPNLVGKSTAESTSARRERTSRLLNEYAQDRAERVEERTRAAAALAERRRNCAHARHRLQELEHTAYIYDRDAAGNKVILPDSEFRKEKNTAREQVTTACRGDANAASRR